MKTLKRPTNGHTNGHARFDADLVEAVQKKDMPIKPPVNDPIDADEPIAPKRASKRKPLREVSFQKLLDEIAQEEAQPRAERPAFPLNTLPPALRTWVEAVAQQTQTAPEAAAMLGLAASSAALAGIVKIFGTDDAWHSVNLYVGVLHGGDRCDDVMSLAIEPLRELEVEELFKAEETQAKDRVRIRQYERTLQQEERKHEAAGNDEAIWNIGKERVELELEPSKPAPRRILDDVTARSLRWQLSQLGRIACFSPTGEIFRQFAGRTCASQQRLLETLDAGHAGRRLIVDGPRGKQSPVDSPRITIGSLVDRSLVSAIAGQRECHARSVLAKFLFVSPESRVGSRERDMGLAPEITAAYRDGIRRLTNWKTARPEGIAGLGGFPGGVVPGDEAYFDLVKFEAELEPQLGPRGSLAPIGDWAKQLAGTTLRIAGILHAWTSNSLKMSRETMAAAIEIARWLVPQAAHALEKLGLADDNLTDRERALLRYARAADYSGEFSPRDAWQHLRKTFLRRDALERALARLVHRGYLRIARGGTNFPRRFVLAGLSLALVKVAPPAPPVLRGRAARRQRKKLARAQAHAALDNMSLSELLNESTKSTQPAVGVPPLGGEKAG